MSPTTRINISLLSLSLLGLAGLVVHEGYREQTYIDASGVATVGHGSTTRDDGAPVQPGDRTTPTRALVKLTRDVGQLQHQMRQCIGDVRLFPHEWDAYVSLAYNIGATAFCRSTLVQKLKQHPPDYGGACAEIRRWVHARGRKLPGLVARREAEYHRCKGDLVE